jgi:hypothetical protein
MTPSFLLSGKLLSGKVLISLIVDRKPFERAKTIQLASLASHDIASRLRQTEEGMRPEWESRPYQYTVPEELRQDMLRQPSPHPMDQDSLDRTLIGYCVATMYSPKISAIKYRIRPRTPLASSSYHREAHEGPNTPSSNFSPSCVLCDTTRLLWGSHSRACIWMC